MRLSLTDFIFFRRVGFSQGGKKNEKNIPAQEASQKEGSRIQKPYVNIKRQKSSCKKKSKGQKAAVILKPKTTHSSGLSFTLWENLKVNEILSSAPFDRERRREKRAQGAVF